MTIEELAFCGQLKGIVCEYKYNPIHGDETVYINFTVADEPKPSFTPKAGKKVRYISDSGFVWEWNNNRPMYAWGWELKTSFNWRGFADDFADQNPLIIDTLREMLNGFVNTLRHNIDMIHQGYEGNNPDCE